MKDLQYQAEADERVRRSKEVAESGICPVCSGPLPDGPGYRLAWMHSEQQLLPMCEPCANKSDDAIWEA